MNAVPLRGNGRTNSFSQSLSALPAPSRGRQPSQAHCVRQLPRRGSFISANRQMLKSSPFGGAGTPSGVTERVRSHPSCENTRSGSPQAARPCSNLNHSSAIDVQSATTTTAASGGKREELLGQRPARRKCRPRHEADAGYRNPISGAHLNRPARPAGTHSHSFSGYWPSAVLRAMASTTRGLSSR